MLRVAKYEYAVLEVGTSATVIRRAVAQAWGHLRTSRWESFTVASGSSEAHEIADALNRQQLAGRGRETIEDGTAGPYVGGAGDLHATLPACDGA
ncbi:MAG: hypothetical protein V4472_25165 [Pseudomonadota bacterium]